MIAAISGKLIAKREHYFVVEGGPISFQIFGAPRTIAALPALGETIHVFTYLHVREDALDLYGFLREDERDLFLKLNTVAGVGPKSALGIMGVTKADELIAAINSGKTELLTRASGVGRKIADRVILELRGKLAAIEGGGTLERMESDVELEETLTSLGFTRVHARELIGKIDPKITGFKERLREALRKGKR